MEEKTNSIIQVNSIFDKGSSDINEDNYLIKNNLFGVFDGASSLNKYVDENKKTGGYLASLIAKNVFVNNCDNSLKELLIKSNKNIKSEMISKGININEKLNLWSTSAAVVRINNNHLEWVQIGDSLIIVINEDDSYELLVNDYDHDEEILILWKELADKNESDIRTKLMPQLLKVRKGMNVSYGILNGEENMVDFINQGTLKLKNIKDIILFTDGLFIPKENPKDKDDFDLFVKIYLEEGLEKIKEYVRNIEKKDKDCKKYPRFKQHDDIAGISIKLRT